jgi:cellulose synthase/poly-beta-1,6-N-acetylglucosamine synthase-like glycosyltransferase
MNFQEGDDIFVEVFVPASTSDIVQVIKIIGPPSTERFDPFEVDHLFLNARKRIFEIDSISTTNSTVILEIISNSPHAHYGVRCGKEEPFEFLEYTLSFAFLTQSLRLWSGTFTFFVFFLILTIAYFFTWPLHRYKTYVIFPKLATICFLSWILDTFYQYFHIVQYINEFSFLTFVFHVVPNVTYVILLAFVYNKTRQKELWLIIIGSVSFLFGGGGFYIGSLCLFVSYAGLITMKNSTEDKEKKSLICKV